MVRLDLVGAELEARREEREELHVREGGQPGAAMSGVPAIANASTMASVTAASIPGTSSRSAAARTAAASCSNPCSRNITSKYGMTA